MKLSLILLNWKHCILVWMIIRFSPPHIENKIWGAIRWAVDRWQPVGRGLSTVNVYPQW